MLTDIDTGFSPEGWHYLFLIAGVERVPMDDIFDEFMEVSRSQAEDLLLLLEGAPARPDADEHDLCCRFERTLGVRAFHVGRGRFLIGRYGPYVL